MVLSDRHPTASPRPIPSVRRVSAAEHAAVGEIAVSAYEADELLGREGGSQDHYPPLLRGIAVRDAEAEVWVAVDGDDLLGTVTWCPPGSPWREVAVRADEGEFRMLAVRPGARRRGAARALVAACVARARADGMREIVISSLPQMAAAHALYRSFGFERDSSRDHRPLPHVELWVFRLGLASG
jgi:ribosomal protein S18 acetylase RimI-like enzyme